MTDEQQIELEKAIGEKPNIHEHDKNTSDVLSEMSMQSVMKDKLRAWQSRAITHLFVVIKNLKQKLQDAENDVNIFEAKADNYMVELEKEKARAERWKGEAVEDLKALNFQMDGSPEDVKEIIERIDKGEK